MTVQDVEMLDKLVDRIVREANEARNYVETHGDEYKKAHGTKFGNGYLLALEGMARLLDNVLEDCIG